MKRQAEGRSAERRFEKAQREKLVLKEVVGMVVRAELDVSEKGLKKLTERQMRYCLRGMGAAPTKT